VTPDAIVVGGGVVGLSAARELAGQGARVTVVERRRVGEEASAAAAGMLAPQVHADADTALLDLSLRARDRHLALAGELQAETGISVELSSLGALDVAFTDDDERALSARIAWQRGHGLPVEELTAEEIRQAEPNLNPAVRKGALIVERGRVAGVRTGAEVLRAPVVVNAAGAWAGRLEGDPDPPPVEPVRGQIATFVVAPALVRHVVWSARGYLVPRADGRLLAGTTLENAGFDKSVTAGGLRAVLDIALEIAPRLVDVPIVDTWAGLRPGTPDGWPILGAGGLDGLFHAAGLFRNGILLGPLAGESVARLALGRPPGIDLAPFAVTRFRAPR
jgi:glycine oxidase